MSEFGFGITRPSWRLRIGIGWGDGEWSWAPGISNWGRSSPGEYFNTIDDHHWLWTWLIFRVFFAGCGR